MICSLGRQGGLRRQVIDARKHLGKLCIGTIRKRADRWRGGSGHQLGVAAVVQDERRGADITMDPPLAMQFFKLERRIKGVASGPAVVERTDPFDELLKINH
ncbi:hypothetical protein Pla123a_06250 [Posidoniimonas polymericola]|uniref:Uncharacterized protein n=1 Tax=Posidoniimonas polymericola TaxID=2528002 RepID=A0A5C5ZF62_9BACT|nr:hypothetical protein Pla123a_06250 [Posidoniimonas polymericola]